MPEINLTTILQTVVALGLLNVWLMRSSRSTAYRGGSSQTLKEEFAAYGLPVWFFYLVGVLKVGSAIALIVGLWVPSLVMPAAGVVVGLMLGALVMHIKVRDPILKSLPALLVLAMSASILGLSIG
tara:strand:+ start:5219 stop:5596 length:378 start_codon:yes stop_codon:yes gene_type:complete